MTKGVKVSVDKVARVASPNVLICRYLKNVPTALFVNMVSRAGFPHDEAKDLCAAFKALKE